MASVKELKKDINFLATELVTEAYVKELLIENVDTEKIAKALTDAIVYRNELIARVNHPDGKHNPKIIKAYYNTLRKDMLDQFLKISEDINNI